MVKSNYLETYFICGTRDVDMDDFLLTLETSLKNGVTCYQFREKGPGSLTSPTYIYKTAQLAQRLCQQYDVPFIVNDDLELALKLNADGIHVGQSDTAIKEVIQAFPNKIIGLSCHSVAEIKSANEHPEISYYGVGPVFSTTSKSDAEPPIYPDGLKECVAQASKPVVAIGGIQVDNVAQLKGTGVAGVSVISAIARAKDKQQVIKQLKSYQ